MIFNLLIKVYVLEKIVFLDEIYVIFFEELFDLDNNILLNSFE